MVGLDFKEAIDKFQNAMLLIPMITKAKQHDDLEKASKGFACIASLERQAFTKMKIEIEPN